MTMGSPAFMPFAPSSQNGLNPAPAFPSRKNGIPSPPTASDVDGTAGSGKQKANADVTRASGIDAASKVEMFDGSCEPVSGAESVRWAEHAHFSNSLHKSKRILLIGGIIGREIASEKPGATVSDPLLIHAGLELTLDPPS